MMHNASEQEHLLPTGVWQKWRFSAPQTVLWLIKIWFSASTFVVKIATFAKRQNVRCNHDRPQNAQMRTTQTEYYFSTITLFFGTIFMTIFTIGPSYLFIKFYKDNLLAAIALSLPLIVILIGLPDYLRFMYCAIRKRPALILNDKSLINNADGKVYSWNEIKSISYEPHTGFRAPRGGYISVALKDTERKFRIPQNSIKCKTTKLLQDLQKYHRAFHRQEFDKSNGSPRSA